MKLIARSFTLLLAALLTSVAMAQPVRFIEGTHYETIAKPVRTVDPNKIEVTEVFWYLCPHCRNFEPSLQNWVSTKLPADAVFVRSPVGTWQFQKEDPLLAKIYYTEQALGITEKTHKLFFSKLQDNNAFRTILASDASIKELFVSQGVDPKAFDEAWNSFAVATEVKKAAQRQKDYGVSGVPALIVNGKYLVSGRSGIMSEAQMQDEMLQVVDFLIAKERAAKKK